MEESRMKRLSITAFAVFALGFSSAGFSAGISAPTDGEIIFQNTLELSALDETATQSLWAVRFNTCAANTGTVAGNVDGFSDPFNFDAGYFEAEVDISGLDAGRYCFVFNSGTNRYTQWFYIVDEYAKVSGTIKFDPATPPGDIRPGAPFDPMPGNSPTHAFSGFVGNAGVAGTVGSIDVNYRELGETCSFTATSLSLDDNAPGIVGTGENLRAVIRFESACGNGFFFALDKSINLYTTLIGPRGGVVVRVGVAGASNAGPVTDYHIDNTLGSTGGASWVSLERGEAWVGTR
jgi:hypothetical protein